MQVKPSTSTPTLHLKEQELNPEQSLNELCRRILSGLGEGKVLCVKKMGERETLVLRNLSVWERIFHRCFHWKKQELRQGTISHFLEKVWNDHRSEIRQLSS